MAGRPKIDINYELVDKLLIIQCTGEEIASCLNIDYDTLQTGIKAKYKMNFSEYSEQKRCGGKASLRRMQWKKAENGDTTMLIWLGKQILEQKDKKELDLGNKDDKPFKSEVNLSKLSVEELKNLESIIEKTSSTE